jgi:hypothetical protein
MMTLSLLPRLTLRRHIFVSLLMRAHFEAFAALRRRHTRGERFAPRFSPPLHISTPLRRRHFRRFAADTPDASPLPSIAVAVALLKRHFFDFILPPKRRQMPIFQRQALQPARQRAR